MALIPTAASAQMVQMVILMAIVLVIGLYLPAPLVDMLNDAVRFLEGQP